MEYMKHLIKYLSEPKYAVGIQTLILGITALIVSIYTYLTYRLWKESKIQTDLAQTPYLILRFCRDKSCWFIKNIGLNTATKIEIEGQKIFLIDVKKCLELRFETIEILEPKEEKKVPYKAFEDGREQVSDIAPYFFSIIPSSKPKKGKNKFRITYKNILGQKFYFLISMGEDEYRIERFGKDKLIPRLRYKIPQKMKEIYITIKSKDYYLKFRKIPR